jgi:tryptophan synthase alpha chain
MSPFLVLGDPTPELSVELARRAVVAGAGMLEIGFPYGDPVADGPAIQAADVRALSGGTSTTSALRLLATIREDCPRTPLNLLVYGNLVHARGLDRFCREAADAGASSLLVPDIPLEESAPLKRACRAAHIGHVQLVGPLTSSERLRRIGRAADAFVYLVAHQGVTGVREGAFDRIAELVRRTSEAVTKPVCIGFGLSNAEQIERAFASGARIAVVGSHLANVIGASWPKGDEVLLSDFESAVRALAGSSDSKRH